MSRCSPQSAVSYLLSAIYAANGLANGAGDGTGCGNLVPTSPIPSTYVQVQILGTETLNARKFPLNSYSLVINSILRLSSSFSIDFTPHPSLVKRLYIENYVLSKYRLHWPHASRLHAWGQNSAYSQNVTRCEAWGREANENPALVSRLSENDRIEMVSWRFYMRVVVRDLSR